MTIFAIGINHKTAPIAVREKLYFATDKLALYLQDILNQEGVREAVLLSTCNRSELYCDASLIVEVLKWFYAQTTLSPLELEPFIYIYQDEAAIEHMTQVACGLDSLVLGEPEILGQVKAAFSESVAAGAIGSLFHRLFQHIFSVAKEIRSVTTIGACPVSVATTALYFAKQQCPHLATAQVVVIGAGEASELLLRYLKGYVMQPIFLLNRSLDKAQILGDDVQVIARHLNELPDVLMQADVVFSATSSVNPIITQAMMRAVMQHRLNQPMTLIDIAVPRDIDADVALIENVHLYCIDDLKTIIEQHKQGRTHAAEKAREMIQAKSQSLMHELASIDKIACTIRAYRGVIEDIGHAELMKAKQQLLQGVAPELVLETFAHGFTNKLLHIPSVQLRQAGVEGRFELLRYAKQLFAIPDHEVEPV